MLKKHFSELFDFQKKSKIKAGDGLKLELGKYPFYTSSNVLTKSIDEYLFDKPSLVFGTGGLASVHFCDSKFAVSTDCLVAQPKDDKIIFSKYVYHYLSANIHILEEGFKGAGLKHISKGYISNISIPLPPLETQKKITLILDNATSLRNKTEQLIKEYDDLEQSIFLDMFGDPVINTKGWQEKKLGILINIKHGFAFKSEYFDSKGYYTLLTPGNFYDDGGYKDQLSKQKYYNGEFPPEYLLQPQQMLIAMTEQAVGLLGSALFVPSNGKYLHNQRLGLVEYKKPLDATYLYYILNNNNVRLRIQNDSTGTKVKHTSPKKIMNIAVGIPPIELQNEFAEKIVLIEKQKELAKKELKESEDLFNCLLQKAFKGELV